MKKTPRGLCSGIGNFSEIHMTVGLCYTEFSVWLESSGNTRKSHASKTDIKYVRTEAGRNLWQSIMIW